MKISVVATLYNSVTFIEEFHRRVSNTVRQLTDDYEIILVNDGSPDNSLAIALEVAKNDPHVIIVDLSRNFGHHHAILTGLSYASGERIFLIDSDLEEEPEWLQSFIPQMDRSGCDVVYGVQETRKGKWFEKISGRYFYTCFRMMTGLDLPRNLVTARLMSRRYLDALLSFPEREIFLGGLMLIAGFDQCQMPVRKHSNGKSNYTLRRKLYLFTNSITSFTNTPLVAIFFIGIAIFAIAALFTLEIVIQWLFFSKPLTGWTSVIASIWLLGGLMISFIGIIGIYLSKVFSEVKQRPNAIIKAIYRK